MNAPKYMKIANLAVVLSAALLASVAEARIVTPNPIVLQQAGDVAVLNIADEGACNADILVTPLDLSIIQALSTNPTTGINVNMELVANGVGTTKLLVQWIEFGLDGLRPCLDTGFVMIDVVVGPVPMRAEVRDAQTNLPITNAQVYARAPRDFYGFRVLPTAVPGIYQSAPADLHPWDMKVFAPGYEPSDGFSLIQTLNGALAGTIYLQQDPQNSESNIVKVRIRLLDSEGFPTGQSILTESVDLTKDGRSLGLNPTFNKGTMIFPGVPSGTIGVTVPNTANISYSSTSITLGTGVIREVILDATLTSSSTAPDSFARMSTRGGFTGSIVGDVYNSASDSNEIVKDATIINKQDSNNIATYANANQIGSYYHSNITAGSGKIYAVSPDETIQGPKVAVNIVSGQLYGDDDNEDTRLTIPLSPTDTDGDGLPDDFVNQYLLGYPADQRGAEDDPDGDGLSNFEEYQHGTDPSMADSDGDGYPDGLELELGTDPHNGGSVPQRLQMVWVDFGYDEPIQAGTLLKPAGSLQVALGLLAEGGTIQVKGDVEITTSNAPDMVIDTPASIQSVNGQITVLGRQI